MLAEVLPRDLAVRADAEERLNGRQAGGGVDVDGRGVAEGAGGAEEVQVGVEADRLREVGPGPGGAEERAEDLEVALGRRAREADGRAAGRERPAAERYRFASWNDFSSFSASAIVSLMRCSFISRSARRFDSTSFSVASS